MTPCNNPAKKRESAILRSYYCALHILHDCFVMQMKFLQFTVQHFRYIELSKNKSLEIYKIN
jgi:hypothetical protein